MRRCALLILGICCLLTAPAAIAREWKNASGKKLEADFLRFKDYDTVILRRERDGKEFTIKVDSLCSRDRTYLSRKRSALDIKRKPHPTDPFHNPDRIVELDEDDDDENDIDEALDGEEEDDDEASPPSGKKKKAKGETSEQTKIITIVVLVLLNIPIYLLFGKVMFHNLSDFFDCVKYYLTPNWLSWARGELTQDWTQSFKLGVFFLGCGALVFVEFFAISFFLFN